MTDSLHQLTRLRTDTNRIRWTEATAFRAPHKPFLILSILDLTAQGQIDSPFITPLCWGDRNCMGRFSYKMFG